MRDSRKRHFLEQTFLDVTSHELALVSGRTSLIDFQVQRYLHDTDILFTNRIHDVHLRQGRSGIVGFAEHRGGHGQTARKHSEQTEGMYKTN